MPREIWKFTVDPWDSRVEMPAGSRLLHVHEQAGRVCVWADVDPAAPTVERVLVVVGTGHPIPRAAKTYVGTAHITENGHRLVLHLYEGQV
jgi:hypothetical protein